MAETLLIQGRRLQEADVKDIGELIAQHPTWSRRRISQQLCRRWEWRNGAGRYKDMAARTLLLKLQQRNLIALPERRQIPTNRMRAAVIAPRLWDQTPIEGSLAELGELQVEEVSQDRRRRKELAAALEQFHFSDRAGARWARTCNTE